MPPEKTSTEAEDSAEARKKPDLNAELIAAIAGGDAKAVQRLLAEGASVDARSEEGEPALHLACGGGEIQIVEPLLDAGAEVDTIDDNLHWTALISAVQGKHVPVIELLLARGANVDYQGEIEDHNTPLLMALDPNWSEEPPLEVVRALLRGGANPSIPNERGWTPLMFAAHAGAVQIVDLLLAAGADPKARRAGGIHAIDVATAQGHSDVEQRLIAAGSPTLAETAVIRMREIWRRIDGWLEENAPPCHEGLARATGASPEQIAKLQRALGEELPVDFRAYLQRFGDGERVPFYEYDGLPLERMLERWEGLEELRERGTFAEATPHELSRDADEVKWQWWHRGWLPFAQDGGGNLYCVDLDPGAGGQRGQVIKWEMHGGPVGPVASSFEAFLDRYLERLEDGDLRYDDGALIPR